MTPEIKPRCKYDTAEFLDAAVEAGSANCVVKRIDTVGQAKSFYMAARQMLARRKRKDVRWAGVEVFRRGNCVYAHLKEECREKCANGHSEEE